MVNKRVWLGMLVMVFGITVAGYSSITIDQRVIGTWQCVEGKIWVFNADGTGSVDGSNRLRYTMFSSKIAIYMDTSTGIFPVSTLVSDYIVSGRTFVLHNPLRAVWLERRMQ